MQLTRSAREMSFVDTVLAPAYGVPTRGSEEVYFLQGYFFIGLGI